jgi:acyl-homoserine-lactone acylase
MKKQIIVLIVLLLFLNSNYSQINPNNIEIVRDNYGVPHIYGKTDAEVAYGLAWTHSEDDFKTIQQAYLAGNGLLSKHIGVKGAPADFLTQLIESKETVDKLFNTLSPDFIKVAQGYAEGINKYAELHPKEILEKSLFPISVKKMLRYSFLQLFISNEAGRLVSSIVSNNVPRPNPIKAEMNGSNTFAFNSIKTGKNETYLAINTHQPLDGPTSWYEAHLISEEGTNIIGATFAGAPSLLIGANQNLAWAHTVNYPDKADVFELEMHPTKKWHYLVDGETYKLEKKQAKLFVKFLGIRLKVSKKYFTSIYGPTLKNKSGFYSVRTPSLFTIKSLEQWWRMNKANSFTEFYNILKKNDLPGYNIGYADKNDTIFYISNGIIPKRNDQYDWRKVVPGNTKKTLWDSYYKTEELPQVINPKSGYVYNANHSPFKSTSKEENPLAENFSKNMGYELYDNNRSTRLYDLINSYDKIDYKDFKKIKYDRTLPTPLNYNYVNINKLFKMNPDDYPEISDLLVIIQNWDREANADSFGAGAYAMMYYNLGKYYPKLKEDKVVSQKMLEECLKEVTLKKFLYLGYQMY